MADTVTGTVHSRMQVLLGDGGLVPESYYAVAPDPRLSTNTSHCYLRIPPHAVKTRKKALFKARGVAAAAHSGCQSMVVALVEMYHSEQTTA